MAESSSDFRDTLLALTDTSAERGNHPSPDRWIAYHRGELAADEEARLQEHLVHCRDCFDLAEGAAAFAAPDEEPGAGGEVETAAVWRLLRPQLDPTPPAPPSSHEVSDRARRRPARGFRLLATLAASFFVALVGMGAWSLHLRSALEELRRPKPDAPIYHFLAGERLSTPASSEKILSAGGSCMLSFHPDEELPVYRLAVYDAAGRELGAYELRPNEDLALALQLPEGFRPGRYRLELSDGSGGRAGRVLEAHRGGWGARGRGG